jgi:inhibitor of KinA sporulation pathway (predicted exonuclease)
MTDFLQNEPDHWLVIDLEATCCDANEFARDQMEIIEIGAVIADGQTFKAVDEFQTFVRPVRNAVLTDFCRQLTGIEQANVDAASGFAEAMSRLTEWMQTCPPAVFCSWGDYDRKQFERDCALHEVAWPFGIHHVNLKKCYAERFRLNRGDGFGAVLKKHDLTFEGWPHRGIDDARNIVRVLPIIFQ